jgi:general secretion pathway protein L
MIATKAFTDILRGLLAWWKGEMWQLLPIAVRDLFQSGKNDLVIEFDGDAVAVTQMRTGRRESLCLGPDESSELRKLISAVAPSHLVRSGVRLRVPSALCLVRRITVPATARHKLKDIVKLDLASGVPLATDEYLSAYHERAGDGENLEIECVILKRRFVERELRVMAGAGYPATALDAWDETGQHALPVNLLPVTPDPRRALRARVSAAMLIAAALLLPAALQLALWGKESALARLDGQIGEWKSRANRVMSDVEAAASLSEALAGVRRRKLLDPSPLAYWNELATLIPDDGWVTNLIIEPRKISLMGGSQSPADLIGILEQSPLFSEVSFSSPVTRDTATGVDRFAIELAPEDAALDKTASK